MSEIQRYEYYEHIDHQGCFEKKANGKYIKYSDCLKEIERLKEALKQCGILNQYFNTTQRMDEVIAEALNES